MMLLNAKDVKKMIAEGEVIVEVSVSAKLSTGSWVRITLEPVDFFGSLDNDAVFLAELKHGCLFVH